MVNNAILAPVKALFPQHCLLCRLPSGRDLPLCHRCERELPPNDPACTRCAVPLHTATAPDAPPMERICSACLTAPPLFTSAVVPWLYSAQLAHILHRWKYARDWRLTALLAYLWCKGAGQFPVPDVLLPVPLHWAKRWRRGANQAELLCRHLHHRGIESPVDTQRVRRTRHTRVQSQLSAEQRQRNLAGAFTVTGRCDNLTIAVVDDVLTTGATAAALAGALLEVGAARVDVWCLARTPPPRSG